MEHLVTAAIHNTGRYGDPGEHATPPPLPPKNPIYSPTQVVITKTFFIMKTERLPEGVFGRYRDI